MTETLVGSAWMATGTPSAGWPSTVATTVTCTIEPATGSLVGAATRSSARVPSGPRRTVPSTASLPNEARTVTSEPSGQPSVARPSSTQPLP